MNARVPRYPPLTWKRFQQAHLERTGCVLDAPHVAFTTSGRMATALALQHLGVGPGDEILLPAYHCPTMVYPVQWTGATPRYYQLSAGLEANLSDLRQKLNRHTRAVVVTHYFGFAADLAPLRTLCDEFGLALIEDCAHALFGGSTARPIGSTGDYAVSSLMKFLPVAEGGCLSSGKHRVDSISQRSGGIGFELKSAINALEISVSFGRLQGVGLALRSLMAAKDLLLSSSRHKSPLKPQQAAQESGQENDPIDFDARFVGVRMTAFSRLVAACVSLDHNRAQRRKNYKHLQDAFSALKGCRALKSHLDDDVVPYVFPLWVDRPDTAWASIQRAGLPMMRWDRLFTHPDDEPCRNSMDFARHVVQIPCHQELNDDELADLVRGMTRAVSQA